MITVIKNNHTGREVWRYTGEMQERGATWIRLEAFFNAQDRITEYHTFHQGDRFVEWFYTDRWYSIFEMHDVQDDRLVGWYCNIARPALITLDRIEADDLALDLFVRPDGSMIVLDEDEFAALPLEDDDREQVLAALVELQTMVTQHSRRLSDYPYFLDPRPNSVRHPLPHAFLHSMEMVGGFTAAPYQIHPRCR